MAWRHEKSTNAIHKIKSRRVEIQNNWWTPENNVDKTKTTQTQHLIKTYEQHGPHQKPGVDSGAP